MRNSVWTMWQSYGLVDVRVLPMTLPVMVRHLQALPFTNTFWIKNTWRKQDQWPYLRLPEIYLSYAEALNEVGRTSDAYQYVNYVRARVRLPGLKSGLTQDEMRKEILDERAREFGVEEVRYYDMIRWKQAKDFRKILHGIRIRRGDNSTYSYEKFSIKKRFIQDGEDGTIFFTPKWYLSPFPFVEMNKDI